MKRLGFWILGAAAGSFAAGLNLGLMVPELMAATDAEHVSSDELFVRSMVADYGLSARQEKSLRLVLQKRRDDEFGVFRRAEFSQLPAAIQNRLLAVRDQAQRRIRAILDETQRARYDRATKPK